MTFQKRTITTIGYISIIHEKEANLLKTVLFPGAANLHY